MANPRGQQRDKPFREALRLEIAALQAKGDERGLRKAARALIENAENGDNVAIKELADRLDGKVPQAVVGDEDGGPVVIEIIRHASDADKAAK
jgi:hypothetical protein